MEKKIYLSSSAAPGGDGSENKPFASLCEARDGLRKLRSSGEISQGDAVTVLMHGGEYYVGETFKLEEIDSGTCGAPLTIRACEGETVTVTGARTLAADKFYKPSAEEVDGIRAKYPEAADKIVAYDLRADGVEYGMEVQLYWNGERGTVARYPNSGYIFLKGVEGFEDYEAPEGDKKRANKYSFEDDTGLIRGWKKPLSAKLFGNFEIDWVSSEGEIIELDREKGRVTMYCDGYARDGGRYYFSDVLDELDTPGEYFIDKETGILYFYPDGDIKDIKVQITQCGDTIFDIKADYITLEGVTVEGGRDDLIRVDGTGNVISKCIIRRCRKTGVIIDGYKNTITRCELYTIGGTGIDMGGGDPVKLTPGDNVITDNVIHHFGEIFRVYNGGVFFRGRGITCRHNELYHAPHLAMSMLGSELVIEYNYIHNVCYEAADAGAVYLGGWAPNDIQFNYNIIKDVFNIYGTGCPNGYYNDDGGGGKTIRCNLFINITGNAFAMGGGRDNIIEDNIMIDTHLAYDQRLYYDTWEMHNAIYPRGLWTNLFGDPAYWNREWALRYPRTLYIKTTNVRHYDDNYVPYAFGHVIIRNNVTYPLKMKMDIQPDTRRLSIIRDNVYYDSLEDVGFVDFENGNYELRPDSKIFHDLPGFEACNFNLAGVR